MSSDSGLISHVSDTALMTAACRALETDRIDGWIRDPLAKRLAGERGMAIAQALPRLEIMSFGVGMRTRLLDDMITAAIRNYGISTVLSVGAGLDTRPWRLNFPQDLRWLEVDLPAILDYKTNALASETPKCHVERMAADLNDPAQRTAVLTEAANAPALMITEGLLMYLPAATVQAIATEAFSESSIRYWMLDLATGDLAKAIRMSSFRQLEAVRPPDNLDGEGIIRSLNSSGWAAIESRTYGVHGMRAMPRGRAEALTQLSRSAEFVNMTPPSPDDLSGVHLFAPER